MRVRRLPFIDEYVEDGEAAVMIESHVVVLSAMATEICLFLGAESPYVREVASHLVDCFGEPPVLDAETMTLRLLDELAAQKLVELIVA